MTDGVNAGASSVPLDSELWGLTRTAVEAAGASADAHLVSAGYRPRVALPEVDSYDSGWPRLTKTNRLLAPEDAPTDYTALFGTTRDVLHPFAYEDVPELAAFLDYVRGHPDLRSRLTVASPTGDGELLADMLDFEAARLPLSVLDRARAVDATGPNDLLSLYLERAGCSIRFPLSTSCRSP